MSYATFDMGNSRTSAGAVDRRFCTQAPGSYYSHLARSSNRSNTLEPDDQQGLVSLATALTWFPEDLGNGRRIRNSAIAPSNNTTALAQKGADMDT